MRDWNELPWNRGTRAELEEDVRRLREQLEREAEVFRKASGRQTLSGGEWVALVFVVCVFGVLAVMAASGCK